MPWVQAGDEYPVGRRGSAARFIHPHSANYKWTRQKPNSYQLSGLYGPGGGDLAHFAQIEFAGAEIGQRVDVEDLVGTRLP